MLCVRLSDEEYLALRKFCKGAGARSVSDLTRDTMRELLNSSSRNEALHARMDKFLAQINGIDHKIEVLTAEISRLRASGDD
jgi:hypothetical protein